MTKLEEPMARTSMADGSKPETTRPLARPIRRAPLWPWLLVALLVLAATAAAIWYFHIRVGMHVAVSNGQQAGAAGGPGGGGRGTPVVVATARQGDMSQYLVGIGAVDPFYTVTVHTRVDGQIMKVDFDEGQDVKKDEPLIEIDPRPYEAALLQAQGQLDKDQAELVNAKLNVQRDKEAGTAVSAQQLSTDVATEQQTEGAIKIDQAAINTAQLNVTYSHITSPIDGRIGLRLVDPGNIVHAADTTGMAVITQLAPIAVVFSLPEDDIGRVVDAMKNNPHLPVEAFDRTGKVHIANGALLTIDNEVDPNSATFKLKALFDNKDGKLFPSQFVNARMLVGTIHNAVIVPAAGVQQGPDSNFVYVVQPDSTVQLRNVTVTQLAGNEILVANNSPANLGEQSNVETGLSAGDVIVTDGVDKLVQGAKVQVTKQQGSRGNATTSASSGAPGADANGAASGGAGMAADQSADGAQAAAGMHHHHRHAASGPADKDGAAPDGEEQSAAGDATGDATGAAGGAAGGAWHHHHPTSGPADDSTPAQNDDGNTQQHQPSQQ